MSTFGSISQASPGIGAGPGVMPGSAQNGQGGAAAVEDAIRTFAMMMAEEMLLGKSASPAEAIAKKLPGATENVNARMQTLREEEQLVSDRREIGRKMSEKDNAMAFRN
jgi:hypothetical protein